MSVYKYVRTNSHLDLSQALVEAYGAGVQSKAMLTALGDYWTDYYIDADTLSAISAGAVALYSQEYSNMLDYVLASNIIDMPVSKPFSYQLYGFSEQFFESVYNDQGVLQYYKVDFPGVESLEFFVSTLFEPEVILEYGKHYELIDGELRWYVDIFGDEGIATYAYTSGEIPYRQVLLWATNIAFDDYLIYNRYGIFLYKKDKDGHAYHWLITALLHYYTNTKSLTRIEAVLNVLYGLPITRFSKEVVQKIDYVDNKLQPVRLQSDAAFHRITTNKYVYYTYIFAKLQVKEGQTLQDFQLLARFHEVDDYISKPDWYKTALFPDDLIEEYDGNTSLQDLMDKVLKYNIVYIRMAITFETYTHYMTQLKELYNIIKSGFPVYLYPFVSRIFEVQFSDDIDIEEIFNLYWLQMRQKDRYERCYDRNFTGRNEYNSKAALDHGSKYVVYEDIRSAIPGQTMYFNGLAVCANKYDHTSVYGKSAGVTAMKLYHLRFNSKSNYDHYDRTPNWHRPTPEDAPRFDSKYQYSKPVDKNIPIFGVTHNCNTDDMLLTSDLLFDDAFSWSNEVAATKTEVSATYGGQVGFTGNKIFGKETLVENYEFWVSLQQKFEDSISIAEVFSKVGVTASFTDYVGEAIYFSGYKPYSGASERRHNLGKNLKFIGDQMYVSPANHTAVVSTDKINDFPYDYDSEIFYGHSGWYKDEFSVHIIYRD